MVKQTTQHKSTVFKFDIFRTLKRNKRKVHPRAGNVNSQDAIELKDRG